MLPQLHSVTKLHSAGCYGDRDRLLGEAIASCPGLRAYCCANRSDMKSECDDIPEVFQLTQLTELGIVFRWGFLPELCWLTLLEHLSLEAERTDDKLLDRAVRCMPHLKTVHIKSEEGVQGEFGMVMAGRLRLSGHAFSEAHQLESLRLDCVDIDVFFFRALASKPGLTELEFISSEHRSYSRDFMSEVNLLRNLEKLTLHLRAEHSVGDLISPWCLSRLKRLNVSGTEDEVAAARRRFDQSLHPALVNWKESPWRSRFLLP